MTTETQRIGEPPEMSAASKACRRLCKVEDHRTEPTSHGKCTIGRAATPAGQTPGSERPPRVVQVDLTDLDIVLFDAADGRKAVASPLLASVMDMTPGAVRSVDIGCDLRRRRPYRLGRVVRVVVHSKPFRPAAPRSVAASDDNASHGPVR